MARSLAPAHLVAMSHIQRFGAPLLQRQASAARRIWFRLVTRDVDRHGTIIEPAGVDTTAFKANPVFLWMHQSGGEGLPVQPPPDVVIGTVVNFDQTYDHLDIEVEFDDDGEDGLASTCYRKVVNKRIRMVSIGCNPTSEAIVSIRGQDVLTYPTSELLECSLVIIGSNRAASKLDRAAVAAVLRGLDDQPMLPPPVQQPLPRQVSTVAVVANDKMLWGRRRDDSKWTTPGGHAKFDEAPLACAVRELAEEAGLVVPPKRFRHLGDVTTEHGTIVHVFRVDFSEVATPTITRDPDKEISEWQWVQLKDGRLPDDILDNLHAPRNAVVAALRLDRAVAGASGPAVDFLLSAAVDQPAKRGTDFLGDGIDDDDDSVDFDIYGDDDDEGIVVKASDAILCRGVVPYKDFPVVEGTWDAVAAVNRWRKWASSDGSGDKDKIDWAKYAQCFLYVRSE